MLSTNTWIKSLITWGIHLQGVLFLGDCISNSMKVVALRADLCKLKNNLRCSQELFVNLLKKYIHEQVEQPEKPEEPEQPDCWAKEKAEAKLKKLKDITPVSCRTAQEQLNKNSVRFTWKNLSEASAHKVKLLENTFGTCSKCRCDAFKCLRHHLHSEAAKAKKPLFLSTGPEYLQQSLQSATVAISSSSAAPPISSSWPSSS